MADQEIPPHATYDQRYEGAPLPEIMKSGELSPDLRRDVLDLLIDVLNENRRPERIMDSGPVLNSAYRNTLMKVFGKFQQQSKYSTSVEFRECAHFFRELLSGDTGTILKFLELYFDEYVELIDRVAKLIEHHAAPFMLVDTRGYIRFRPITLQAESQAIQETFNTLNDNGYRGATKHLTLATEALNNGSFADCVRESIHAVEAVAKVITENEKATLGEALKALNDKGVHIHKALYTAFSSMYGYSSDEKGIRHSLLEEGEAKVNKYLAMFMFGACASFAAYLVNEHNQEYKK